MDKKTLSELQNELMAIAADPVSDWRRQFSIWIYARQLQLMAQPEPVKEHCIDKWLENYMLDQHESEQTSTKFQYFRKWLDLIFIPLAEYGVKTYIYFPNGVAPSEKRKEIISKCNQILRHLPDSRHTHLAHSQIRHFRDEAVNI